MMVSHYMDLEPGQKPADIELGYIFIGSYLLMLVTSDLQLTRDLLKEELLLTTAIVVPKFLVLSNELLKKLELG